MHEWGRPSLRLTTGLALIVVAIVEIQSFASTLQGQARLRGKLTRTISASIDAARPRLQALVKPGGEAAWLAAIREARTKGLASEAAVLDIKGKLLAAEPSSSRPREGLTPAELDILGAEGSVSVGPVMGESSRLGSYLGLRSGDSMVVLWLATPVPELVLDLRERRPLFVAHGVALTVLAVAALLALFPAGAPRSAAPAATLAYEAAMERLHQRALRDQEQLQRVEDELREKAALARSGELAAGIAHEMRNGINTILGYARLVERSQAGPDAVDAARAIREECETLEVVIRRFIDFVKDEKLEVARFDVSRTLSRVVAREARRKPEIRIALTVEGRGVSERQLLVDGDEELLERAFENLVRNALEAVGSGGQVSLSVTTGDQAHFVCIEDDGPGLPSEAHLSPRAFFSTKPGGLGLGLPIAMKIIRLHGGDLTLQPREPRGLAVHVRLPMLLPGVTKPTPGGAVGEEV